MSDKPILPHPPSTPAAGPQIWVKEWPGGALSVHHEPSEGAREYRCHNCLESTGGQCLEHYEPECTCYEGEVAHMPGCPMRKRNGGP